MLVIVNCVWRRERIRIHIHRIRMNKYKKITYKIDISTPADPLDAMAPDGMEEARRLRPRLVILA